MPSEIVNEILPTNPNNVRELATFFVNGDLASSAPIVKLLQHETTKTLQPKLPQNMNGSSLF
jgi:hypothetical protein